MKLLNILQETCSQILILACSFLRNPFETRKSSNEKAVTTLKDIENRLQRILCYDTLSFKSEDIASALHDMKKFLDRHPNFDYRYRDVLKNEYAHFRKQKIPYLDGHSGEIRFISFEEAKSMKKVVIFKKSGNNSSFEITPTNSHTEKSMLLGNQAIGQIFINGEEAFCEAYAIEHSLRSTVTRWYSECHWISENFERM